jgi:hypothetical protein
MVIYLLEFFNLRLHHAQGQVDSMDNRYCTLPEGQMAIGLLSQCPAFVATSIEIMQQKKRQEINHVDHFPAVSE